MQIQLLGQLPDEIADWSGTAAELADQCNTLMPLCGLAEEAGSANERLIRHYVQVGVLTPPEREGREALFRVRQVAEFLAARRLLGEGWPLTKIGELLKNIALVPDSVLADKLHDPSFATMDPDPTPAEKALLRIRSRGTRVRDATEPTFSVPDVMQFASPTPQRRSSPVSRDGTGEPLPSPSLGVATEILNRRQHLRDGLVALGNPTGTAERQRIVRIKLTPWCHVDIEADQLERLTDADLELLGNTLANALREERLRKGSRP